MFPTIQESRPPYVRFERRPMKDEGKSMEAGKVVWRDIDFAIITPVGSRDEVEKIAEEWVKHIMKQAVNGQYPTQWAEHFNLAYREWKKGNELPANGTPLAMVPFLTPAEVKNLAEANVRTLEDAAQMSEEAMNLVGMGARALKDKCVAYLAGADKGKVAEEIAQLQATNRTQSEIIERLKSQVAELEAAMPKKPRREMVT